MIKNSEERRESVEAIDFDNDLGEELEGQHILKWLIENYPEIAVNAELKVQSANIEARKILEGLIQDCKEHSQEILENKNHPSYEELFKESEKPR